MYPQPELTRLEGRKYELRARIRRQRACCAEAAARVMQPLRWLDQLIALGRIFAPLALASAFPLGLLARHGIAPRMKKLRTWLQWAPTALSVVRKLTGKL
jgi:hypothetical protein